MKTELKDIREIIFLASEKAQNRSKKYANGELNYAFALGFFESDLTQKLELLNLTKKQLKILNDLI